MKPIGKAGSWFANWKGDNIPCVHSICVYRDGAVFRYSDPIDEHPKWPEFIAGIREAGKVIVTDGVLDKDGLAGRRARYVALFSVTKVTEIDVKLEFEFVNRLTDFS